MLRPRMRDLRARAERAVTVVGRERRAQRRDARQRLARVDVARVRVVGRQFEIDRVAAPRECPPLAVQLDAVELRAHAAVDRLVERAVGAGRDRFAVVVHDAAGVVLGQVVREAVVEHADAAAVRPARIAQRQVGRHGLFLRRVRVADQELAGRIVRAVRIQLVEGRRAFGVGDVRRDRPDRRQREQRAGRQAARIEVARLRAREFLDAGRIGIDLHMLEAAAEAQLQRRDHLPFLEAEQRDAVGARGRHEHFVAERRERVLAELHADRAFERPDLAMARLDARLVAAIAEGGRRLAVVDFLVTVVGVREIEFQRRERPAQVAHLGREREAFLTHPQPHVAFRDRAIVRFVAAVRQACETVRPRVRRADRTAVHAAVAVRHVAFRLRRVGTVDRALLAAARVAGNPQLARFAIERVDVECEAAVAAFDLRGAGTHGIRAAVARVERAGHALDRFARNPVVDRVDHAAHRVAAVQQRGRPAHDFDALDRQRILRHRMVVRQRRRVIGRDAVLQQPDPVAVHPADDRPADHRPVGGGRHARQPVERFAERIGLAACQRIAGELDGRGDQFGVAERVRGHEDRCKRRGCVGGRAGRARCIGLRVGDGGEQHQRQGRERAKR